MEGIFPLSNLLGQAAENNFIPVIRVVFTRLSQSAAQSLDGLAVEPIPRLNQWVIRLVLFDIDGTLIRSGGAGVKAFEKTFEVAFGVQNSNHGTVFSGRTDASLVRELFRRHGLPQEPEHFERFFTIYPQWLGEYLKLCDGEICPGVHGFMSDLKALPEPPAMGLLTGNLKLGAELKLRHYGLWDAFDFGGFSDDSEDRAVIAATAKRRGEAVLKRELPGDEVLVVGDTTLDIACGRAIGAKVLAVATGGHDFETLRAASPDWLAGDLTQASALKICGG